jgi:hypothetical protein
MDTRKEAPNAASDAATENIILGGSTTKCCRCSGAGDVSGWVTSLVWFGSTEILIVTSSTI